MNHSKVHNRQHSQLIDILARKLAERVASEAQEYAYPEQHLQEDAVAKAKEKPHKLDISCNLLSEFEERLNSRVIGQPDAVHALVTAYQTFLIGFNPPNRPVSAVLFAGTTGCGKTNSCQAAAEILFGSRQSLTKIDCAEFQHSHEISKLIGCFVPGTKVLMADGARKPIENIHIGDSVISKDGTSRKVIDTYEYSCDGDILEFDIAGNPEPLRVTPGHMIWAIRGRGRSRPTTKAGRNRATLYDQSKLEYIAAKDLNPGDIVTYPRLVGVELDVHNPGNSDIQRESFADNDYIYFRILGIKKIHYTGPVYDISVDTTESYVVAVSVHNSPAGYLGHRETEPFLSQSRIDKYQTPLCPLNLILFDEIEKANLSLWNLLLGILDTGTLTLGTGSVADFTKSIIVMTTNLGAREMDRILKGGCIGFTQPDISSATAAADVAIKGTFTPEFINRIDATVIFKQLEKAHLVEIFRLEMRAVQERILNAKCPVFILACTDEAADWLIAHGTDARYGARELKRTIEKHVVQPLTNVVLAKRVDSADTITVDVEDDKIILLASPR